MDNRRRAEAAELALANARAEINRLNQFAADKVLQNEELHLQVKLWKERATNLRENYKHLLRDMMNMKESLSRLFSVATTSDQLHIDIIRKENSEW